MKTTKKLMKRIMAFLLVAVMAAGLFPVMAAAAQTAAIAEEQPVNLFDKDSDDNWLKALSYKGEKYTSAEGRYDNIFATHKIYVKNGDTLYWGGFGKENYVAEMYNANDGYLGQITFASTTKEATGNTVAGVDGTMVDEYRISYKLANANVAYVRILGNVSTMDDFKVFLNLENGFDSWPSEDSDAAAFENLFDKNDSDIWLKALSYNGSKYPGNNYENIFATHKIYVKNGDTIYWGGFGKENYTAEMYDANDGFLGQIAFTATTHEATGNTVAGVKGTIVEEYRHSYTFTQEKVAYVRILGNISTMDDFKVYLNLPNGFEDWPGRKDVIDVYADMEAIVYKDASGASMPYRLYVPADYTANKTYPVLVFLHGAGERGNDNTAQLVNAIQPLFDTHEDMKDAIVIAPQCPSGKRWVETDWSKGTYDSDAIPEEQLAVVMNILEDVCNTYSADKDRIYAMGLSMGGYGTWNLLMKHSDVFAAGIPICGGADTNKAELLKYMPIWTFHGTADPTVPYKASTDMVNAIKAAGGEEIIFTSYEGAGHGIWNTAAMEEGLIEWLFAQRLSDRNAPANLFDKNHYDNWKQALSYYGQKLVNTKNYANMFATHPIEVSAGDVLEWGNFGKENYVMEVYDANHSFVRQVNFEETTSAALGTTVKGVGGSLNEEHRFTYTIVDENAAYVRILGNISTMNSFMVFKNLEANEQVWPSKYIPVNSVLKGKSVLFAGDSITNAIKDDGKRSGWAGRIGEDHEMAWTNAGVSGASASTCRGSNRVINQLKSKVNNEYDYVILHAGVNDAMDAIAVGEMSDSFAPAAFDTTTFAGGLEELFSYAVSHFTDAKIGYIVNYATPNSNWGGRTKDMSEYFAMAKQICDKWGIPYIDLYEGTIEVCGKELSYSYDIINVLDKTAFYKSDAAEVHIGGVGYDRVSPYIAHWMKSIESYELENVALGKKVEMSGIEGGYKADGTLTYPQFNPQNATDGVIDYRNNRTSLEMVHDAWIQVDLGEVYDVHEVQFHYWPLAEAYEVQVSTDGAIWKTVDRKEGLTGGTEGVDVITLDEITQARYVRIQQIKKWQYTSSKAYSMGFTEIEVYGFKKAEIVVPPAVFEIVTQPVDTSAAQGEDAVVSVEATGEGLTYKWYYKNPGNIKFYDSGTQFVSEDGATYTIPMAAWRDGQEVYCVITDANGETLQTNTVTLTVDNGTVEITKQPVDAAVQADGMLVVVDVKAKGEGLTYQWYYKNPGNVKFYESGSAFAQGNKYVIEVYKWRDGQQVYCVVTDANGAAVQSNTVTISLAK